VFATIGSSAQSELPKEHEQPGPQQDHAQRRAPGDVTRSGADRLNDVLARDSARRTRAAPPAGDRADDRYKAERVDQEQHRGAARGIQRPAQGGTDRPAEVHVDRTERDRLRSVLRRDKLGLERLPHG
jgi:hypothetical protein